MPIIAAAYGVAIIFVTAMPMSGDAPSASGELLSMLLTVAGIGLTFFLVKHVEPKMFASVRQFSLTIPKWPIIVGLFLIAPLWSVAEGNVVYGLTSLVHTVQMEPLTFTAEELREDLTASIHAVLLAPVLEELCFRQMAISPFHSRRAQIVVCVIMGLLFGFLAVIKAVFHAADGGGARPGPGDRFVVSPPGPEQTGDLHPLRQGQDLLDCAEVLEKPVAFLYAPKRENGPEKIIGLFAVYESHRGALPDHLK